MATKCYAQVRGSAIRVTELGRQGELGDPIRYATSKSISNVIINDVEEPGGSETLRTDDEEPRIRFFGSIQTIRRTVDIRFIRVDPSILTLVAGVPVALNAAGDVVGFDSRTRRPAVAFALEVWSKLASPSPSSVETPGFGEGGFGETPFGGRAVCGQGQQWGYTLFPYLRGGYLSGFQFANGVVTFNLVGAQTRRLPRWGVGPYDLEGWHERLTEVVSRTSTFSNRITPTAPPEPTEGIQTITDIIDNGTASNPMPIPSDPEEVDGGEVVTSAWIIEGGRAV